MKLVYSVILLIFAFSLSGQSYNTLAGVRLGDDLKFSFNQRILNHTTLEANLSDGLLSDHKYASLLVKNHSPIITRRFNAFAGAGYYGQSLIQENIESEDFVFKNHGLAGIVGTEITIGRFNIGLDYVLHYNLNKDYKGRNLFADSNLSVKMVLWKRKSQVKKFLEKIF